MKKLLTTMHKKWAICLFLFLFKRSTPHSASFHQLVHRFWGKKIERLAPILLEGIQDGWSNRSAIAGTPRRHGYCDAGNGTRKT
ncbi:MAG: hypothetical protein OXR07_07385 [Nitrospira sp.]|nr:hypothetical protein [Nitrospira sp.]MDD9859590.1 hypothetical protein [Nitrospira sp.]